MKESILDEAKALISGQRADDYGKAYTNFKDIQAIIGAMKEVNPKLVGSPVWTSFEMMAVKLARLIKNPTHRDSWVDICGYAALGAEVAEESDKQGEFKW